MLARASGHGRARMSGVLGVDVMFADVACMYAAARRLGRAARSRSQSRVTCSHMWMW